MGALLRTYPLMKVNRVTLKKLGLWGSAALLSASVGRAQLVNGDFATGDFTGWSITNTVGPMTPYGLEMGGTALAQVVPFDITGTGTMVNSAEFQVGETAGIIGPGAPPAGIVLYQLVLLGSGELTISFDFASYSLSNNGDGGSFHLLIDNNEVSIYSIGFIGYGQTFRSSLSYTGLITGGTHQIGVAVLREGGIGVGSTPVQFLSDFQVAVVPEPQAYALLFIGTTALLFARRARH